MAFYKSCLSSNLYASVQLKSIESKQLSHPGTASYSFAVNEGKAIVSTIARRGIWTFSNRSDIGS